MKLETYMPKFLACLRKYYGAGAIGQCADKDPRLANFMSAEEIPRRRHSYVAIDPQATECPCMILVDVTQGTGFSNVNYRVQFVSAANGKRMTSTYRPSTTVLADVSGVVNISMILGLMAALESLDLTTEWRYQLTTALRQSTQVISWAANRYLHIPSLMYDATGIVLVHEDGLLMHLPFSTTYAKSVSCFVRVVTRKTRNEFRCAPGAGKHDIDRLYNNARETLRNWLCNSSTTRNHPVLDVCQVENLNTELSR